MRVQLHVVFAAALTAGLVACGDDSPRPPAGPSSPAVLVAVTLAGPAEIAPGSTGQFTLTAIYSDNSTSDVSSSALWNAQGTGALRSVGSGRFEGVAAGEGRVQVNFMGRVATKPVLVLPAGTFKLSGVIQDVAGNVGGVDVQVMSGTGAGQSAKSQEFSGRYAVYGVAGVVGLRVSAPGYATQDLSVTVTGHQEQSVKLLTAGTTVDVSGQWTLSVSTSGTCSQSWSPEARKREVVANITQQDTRLTISFQNVPRWVSDTTGRIASDAFSMTLFYDDYYLDWGLTQQVSSTEWVGVNGEFRGVAKGPAIAGTLTGFFHHYVSAPNAQFPGRDPSSCPADPTFEFRR
jgi:hypothetical protein